MESQSANQRLVIIPCGASKIWDKQPQAGATIAKDAYQGAPFKVNRRYAEHCSDRWVILSAKYGFIAPDFIVDGPYEVTFKRKSTTPVSIQTLQRQVEEMGLANFRTVAGLGGIEYRRAIQDAFKDRDIELVFPFSGLPIGKAMQAVNRACMDLNNE